MNLSELRSDCWIIDNFLTEAEIEELTNHIQKIEWVMFDDVQASNFKQPSSKGFHVLEEDFKTIENKYLKKILDLNFSGMPKIEKFDRVLYNCFEKHDTPLPHTDSLTEGCWTFIIYPNTKWEPEWGGETKVMFSPNRMTEENVQRMDLVSPLPGRLLIIPGDVLHSGSGTSVDTPRYSMAYQFWNNK